MSSMASAAAIWTMLEQLPYTLTVAAVAGLCYLIAGFTLINPIIVLIFGIAILYGIMRFFGKSVAEEDLKADLKRRTTN